MSSTLLNRRTLQVPQVTTPQEAKVLSGLYAGLTTRVAATGAHTAANTELVACDTTSGTFAVTLPVASAGKARVLVKWVAGTVAPTVVLSGSDKWNTTGGSSSPLTPQLLNQGYVLESDGSGVWTVTADDLPLSQLLALISGTYVSASGATAITTASFASTLGLPLQVYDNFQRSDRDLSKDVCPSTTLGYALQPEPSSDLTTMSIVSGVARRSTTASAGSPILLAPVRSPITAMGVEFAFTAGTTVPTGAIIGTCAVGFGSGSIQLAVHPTGWQLFRYNGGSTVIASGTFATPLATDGVTRYRAFCWYDAASSSVRISIPAGDGTVNNQVRVITDASIATNWGGNFVAIQHNVNVTSDPDVIFFQFAGA